MKLFSIAKDGRKKLINKSVAKFVRAMKKHIKNEAKKGRMESNLRIDEADIYGLAEGMADEIYEKACQALNEYYSDEVTIEVEHYGYAVSRKRLKATINKI